MDLGDKNKLNKLEDLKKKLFDKNYQVKFEHRENFPHFHSKEVTDSWEKREVSSPDTRFNMYGKTSIFKKFFVFSMIFFVLALVYASFMFFIRSNTVSNENIDISIQSNAFTAGGEEYSLLLEVVNKNNSALQLADLVVEYPKSSASSLSKDNEHIRLSLGTIPAGGKKNENVKFILFGEQGTIRPVNVSLEYRIEGSNAIFVKKKIYDVTISSTPINILVDAPLEANSNQDLILEVSTILNATKPASRMLLKVDYPIGFQFIRATPMPSSNNNVWSLGDLAPGAERKISIVGKMLDVFEGEEKIFRVWSGSQSVSDKSVIETIFNSFEHKMVVRESAIEARLSINGVSNREYAVDTKTGIEGQIQWKNNLETKISNLEIKARISGNAVNKKTISARQGFYNSAQDIIIWDKNSNSQLLEADPGEIGAVSFSLSSLSLFSASSGLLSSPSINIDVFITGEKSEAGGSSVNLASKESRIIKIISDVGLSAKALYASGPFTNVGPLPPKAEQTTSYTITW
ncbi:MAG: hypothetical protein AAB873_03670, partial [Patescibacteria group bacterium]